LLVSQVPDPNGVNPKDRFVVLVRDFDDTDTVVGDELVVRINPNGMEERRRIISCRPERVVFDFPEMGLVLEFHPDRPAT
jgi:hypothetical protein